MKLKSVIAIIHSIAQCEIKFTLKSLFTIIVYAVPSRKFLGEVAKEIYHTQIISQAMSPWELTEIKKVYLCFLDLCFLGFGGTQIDICK